MLVVGEFSSSSIDWWAGPPLQKRDETYLAEDLAFYERTAIDLTYRGRVRFGLDLKFSDELPVVLPSGPLGLQVGFLRLHGAIHVGRPRDDRVIAGRGRGELVGE